MPRNKRVFPFFLDGGIQEVTTASDSWDGTSSFIEVTGSGATSLTVGITDAYDRPIPHGTMLVVKKTTDNYNGVTINPSADFSLNDSTTVLKGGDSMALFVFKGPSTTNDKGEWVELVKVTDESTRNLSSVIVGGTATFSNQIRKENNGTTTAAGGTDAVTAATLGSIDHPVYFVSSDDAAKGVKLNAIPSNNTTITLINTSATAMKLYPDGISRNTINGAASIDLAANAVVRVYYTAGAVYVG